MIRRERAWTRRALAVVAALVAVACTGGDDTATPPADGDTSEPATAATTLDGDLVVFAAASLTDVLDDLARDFVAEHPDVTYVPNYAGSQALATQLEEGAEADLFLSANEAQAQRVVDAGLASTSTILVRNGLAIVVEAGNPLGITGLEDLARDDVVLVLAGEEVPAGQYAAQVLDAAGIEVSPSSLEVDVRAVLSKVSLGEADAGIVYLSDVLAGGDTVEAVELPDDRNVVATYPLVVLDAAPNRGAAEAFADHLASEAARAVFEAAGFDVTGSEAAGFGAAS